MEGLPEPKALSVLPVTRGLPHPQTRDTSAIITHLPSCHHAVRAPKKTAPKAPRAQPGVQTQTHPARTRTAQRLHHSTSLRFWRARGTCRGALLEHPPKGTGLLRTSLPRSHRSLPLPCPQPRGTGSGALADRPSPWGTTEKQGAGGMGSRKSAPAAPGIALPWGPSNHPRDAEQGGASPAAPGCLQRGPAPLPAPAPAPQTGSTRPNLLTATETSRRCRPGGKSPSAALLTDRMLPRFHLDSSYRLKINFSFLLADSQRRHFEQKDAGSSANEKDAPRAGLNSYSDSLFSQLMLRLSDYMYYLLCF